MDISMINYTSIVYVHSGNTLVPVIIREVFTKTPLQGLLYVELLCNRFIFWYVNSSDIIEMR